MRQAFVNPSDLRLVVAKGTVAKLAGTGPALAVNASFFNPSDYGIASDVALGGKLFGNPGLDRPWLAVKNGKAFFGRGQINPSAVDWAAGAGPMLLVGGRKPALAAGETYGSDIVPGGETVKNHRMAVGITADGRVCFITLDGTFGDLRAAFLAAGCPDAMNLDGGGSAQWVEHGVTIVGKDAVGYIRPVVNALVADKVLPVVTSEVTLYVIQQRFLEPGKEHNRPGTPLSPQGIIIHETGTPGATDEDEADYFTSADRDASAHYFVDADSTTQLIPENEQAQHAGPTANSRFLSIELCNFSDPDRFQATWQRAVWLAADICRRHGWSAGPNIYSHKWASDTFKETDHQDPYAYFAAHGKTFQQFCNDVDAALKALPPQPYEVEQLRARVKELEGQLATDECILSDLRGRVDAVKQLVAQWK